MNFIVAVAVKVLLVETDAAAEGYCMCCPDRSVVLGRQEVRELSIDGMPDLSRKCFKPCTDIRW